MTVTCAPTGKQPQPQRRHAPQRHLPQRSHTTLSTTKPRRVLTRRLMGCPAQQAGCDSRLYHVSKNLVAARQIAPTTPIGTVSSLVATAHAAVSSVLFELLTLPFRFMKGGEGAHERGPGLRDGRAIL